MSIQPLPIHDLANIVPMASTIEQEALNHSLATDGYIVSAGLILLWHGHIVDGRCRQIACIKAGINPIDFATELGNKTFAEVERIVFSLNTRRNLTDTQKAIIAYRTSKLAGHTQESASKQWGIHIRTIKFVSSIYSTLQKVNLCSNTIYYGVQTESHVRFYPILETSFGGSLSTKGEHVHFSETFSNALLDALSKDYSVRVLLQDGIKTSSKSVKTIAQRLRLLLEEQELITAEETVVEWNPDSAITTEAGKAYYYTLVDHRKQDIPIDILIELVKYANLKYTLPTTPSTQTLPP